MQFDRLNRRLEGISNASLKEYPVRNLYRLMYMPEIWYEAYANIYSNEGAITKGVNENTLDGFSKARIDRIIKALQEGTYRFTPVRRVYIPKRVGNKKRPLGIPTGDDKLVQEVARIILERIYEPIFSGNSHGFRPARSCHTALEQIRQHWTGIKWFIEFDIEGFFSNMDHKIMVKLLEKRIDDRRFTKLIEGMLKAGYLEDWTYHPTYSGTPQGGIVSPILSNIYLHELDIFMKELEKEFTKGKVRKVNPEYTYFALRKGDIRREIDQTGKRPELIETLKELDRESKKLQPKDFHDENYKRLRYCRYADDFILGIIGTKDEAREIMENVKNFLASELNLRTASDKTGISSGKEGTQFLSYSISMYSTDKLVRIKVKGRYTKRRTVSNRVALRVPDGKAQNFCQRYGYGNWQTNKPTHRPILYQSSDLEIISTYNAELRGLANYYCLAGDVKIKLGKLEYMSNYSLFHTLAARHKTKKPKILNKLKRGNEYAHRYDVKGEHRMIKVFRLKHMDRKPKNWDVDKELNTICLTSPRNELVKRLNCEICEYCGRNDLPLESHHVRKVKDLRDRPNLKKWEEVMIARNRKTLVICSECHDLLHAGKLPDSRYLGQV
jgi:group II intron reverse transcriptase/maturase